jgi:hypothetical protein
VWSHNRLTPGVSCGRKRERSGRSGQEAVSPSPPPLSTARASFPACRSSRLTGSDALLVSLVMTCGVKPVEVRSCVTAPGVHRDEVMEMDLLPSEQGVSTTRTLPTLGFGYAIERAAFGHALTTHLEAPAVPSRFQGGIIRARTAVHLHMADHGKGRHPFASEAEALATSIPTLRRERGARLSALEVAAVDPPRRFPGVPAFRPAPPRSPAGVVHCLQGVLAHHMAVVHGPTADARVQMGNHGFWRDGLVGLHP